MSALTDLLTRLEACHEAVVWANTQPDLATAWETCERGDWMLWLASCLRVRRQDVVLAACAYAAAGSVPLTSAAGTAAAAGAAALAHSAELVRGIIPAAVIVAAAEAM